MTKNLVAFKYRRTLSCNCGGQNSEIRMSARRHALWRLTALCFFQLSVAPGIPWLWLVTPVRVFCLHVALWFVFLSLIRTFVLIRWFTAHLNEDFLLRLSVYICKDPLCKKYVIHTFWVLGQGCVFLGVTVQSIIVIRVCQVLLKTVENSGNEKVGIKRQDTCAYCCSWKLLIVTDAPLSK